MELNRFLFINFVILFCFFCLFVNFLFHRNFLLVTVLVLSGCSMFITADSNEDDQYCEISNYTSIASLEKCSNFAQTIRIRNARLRVIPNDIFQFQRFPSLDFLDVAKSGIQTLDGVQFSRLQKIINLQLYANELKTLPAFVFSNLTILETLSLSQNNITHIDPNAFKGLSVLHYLDLSDNLLSSLEENVFNSLIKLHDLRLTANKLQVIDPDLFLKTTALHSLYLDYNAIIVIEKKAFWPLRDLKTIDISFNPLSDVDFSHLLKIRWISVVNASLTSFTVPESLRELIANNNRISRLNIPEFTVLDTLSINHNSLNDFYNISLLSNVGVVDLSYNGIESVNISRLSPMKNLQNIILSGNPLKELNVSLIRKYLPRLAAIELSIEQWNHTYAEQVSGQLSEYGVFLLAKDGKINNVPEIPSQALSNLTDQVSPPNGKVQNNPDQHPLKELKDADPKFESGIAQLADRIAKLETAYTVQRPVAKEESANLLAQDKYDEAVESIKSVKMMFILMVSIFGIYIALQAVWFVKQRHLVDGLRNRILSNGRARSSDSVNPMFDEGL